MSLEEGIINKKDMEPRTIYLLCPDPDCTLFLDTEYPTYHCERECPRREELFLIFQCSGCGEPISVPINHGGFRAIYSHTCPDGRNIRHLLPDSIPHIPPIKIYEIPK